MKKLLIVFILLAGLFSSRQVLALEKINSFDTTIQIDSDASINVTENINYNFGDLERHGIFRNIPIKYQARGGTFRLRISDLKVTDEKEQTYPFTVSYPGNDIQIKIGDADKLVTGSKTYIINYKLKRAINYFNDHDELYWNVTGNEWQIDIEKASAKVTLPTKIEASKFQKECFAGPLGSQATCDSSQLEESATSLIDSIIFTNNLLPSGSGLTVVVGFPKGIVTKPTFWQNALDTLKDNGILFLPVLIFIILIYIWRNRGRDPKGRGTIVAQFDSPDNISPAEMGTIIDESADPKDISSEIIYLATRGYLKITRQVEGKILKKTDYLLEKLKEDTDLTSDFDKKLMQSIFTGYAKLTKLSSLKYEFYKDLEKIKDQLYDATASKGYFLKNPKKVRNNYIGWGIVAGFIVGILGAIIADGFGIVSGVISGVLFIIFGFIMPAKTIKGIEAKEHILGLKLYLSVAEKDRIKFHNAPEKNPAQFEKLLPYAMVLGVEREWAKQFEGIYQNPPNWYHDPSGTTFNSLLFVSALNSFNTSANTTLASVPRSASGGGSGFGGGGFSGGGFGGGGGGSW